MIGPDRAEGRTDRAISVIPLNAIEATYVGYSVGAGVEYAFLSNWSVKLEYLYVNLGSFDCGIACGATPDNVSFNSNLVRAGVNYRF